MEHVNFLFFFAVGLSFFAAWGIGANDVSNAMGTSVGSRALSIKHAIIAAAIFESCGAILAGGQVTHTIGQGIINFQASQLPVESLVLGMLASLAAAGTWLVVASIYGWPVSTTHCIVGAVMGFGVVVVGIDAIYWSKVINIGLSWIVTPFMAGTIAYILFMSVQKRILNTRAPLQNAKKFGPFYLFIVAFVICMVTFTSGLSNTRFALTPLLGVSVASVVAVLLTGLGTWRIHVYVNSLANTPTPVNDHHQEFIRVEKIFAIMMIFTACAMAFAHGSNDVANAIGPLAAVIQLLNPMTPSDIVGAPIPMWVLCLGALGITLGLSLFGYRVMATIGEGITALTPSRGFAAELATASTVILASATGLPISTTQTLVGAILGVGLARGIASLNLQVIRGILMSWLITLPAGALLSLAYYYLFAFVL